MAETFEQVLAVIVLYKLSPMDSLAFRTLQVAISALGNNQSEIQILLYDNTPEATHGEMLPEAVWYHAAARNEGVAGAYNYALALAQKEGSTWLLTLDQDTNLPADFLIRMRAIASRLCSANEIGAIVPQLSHNDRLLSPVSIRSWGVSYLPRGFTGIARGETHAYNSASLYRADALRQIGGFDPCFWLDYQDAYVYRRLHQHGRQVYVAGDIQVEHDLSLLSQQYGPSLDRFRNFLQAESAFCDLYGGRIKSLALTAKLITRIWRSRIGGANPEIRRLTTSEVKRRIFQPRKDRIQEWRSEMRARMLDSTMAGSTSTFLDERPAISVCMAAYNGSRYITMQLQSILSQLRDHDEIVVVDDASTDDTKEKVLSLQDPRIRLIEHCKNLGVSRTFEEAIRSAYGKILFLSDQDDIWDSHKVETILNAFRSHPDVTLIATDVALIDSTGALILESYFAGRGKFRPGLWANFLKNRFGGCTMAFRAEVITDILPLPHKYDVLHDLWIGVRNSLSGHRALYIPKTLVLNRRHSTTATGRNMLSLRRRIQLRVHLLLALAEFRIQKMMF